MSKKLSLVQIGCLYYFIIRAGYLGISSSSIFHLARQDAWISVIVGIFIGVIPLLLFLFLQKRYPSYSILEMIRYVFGEKIGKVINFILTLFIFVITCIVFYNIINFIGSQYLDKTPIVVIAVMFFIPLTYILSKGLPIIARTHVVLLYLAFLLFFIALLGLFKESLFDNVKPILEFGIFPVVQGGLSFVCINVLPLFFLLIIPRDFIDVKNFYVLKIVGVYFLSSFTLLIISYLMISIFGINLSLLYQYPEFHLLKLISFAGFISRLEGVLAIQWLFDMFALVVMGIYFVVQYLKKDFNLKKRYSNVVMVVICGIMVIGAKFLFKDSTMASGYTIHYSIYLLLLFFFLLPLFVYILGFKKSKNG